MDNRIRSSQGKLRANQDSLGKKRDGHCVRNVNGMHRVMGVELARFAWEGDWKKIRRDRVENQRMYFGKETESLMGEDWKQRKEKTSRQMKDDSHPA